MSSPRARSLRIATFLAPKLLRLYSAATLHISEVLGSDVELVIGRSYEQLAQGEFDGAFVCGLPYVLLAEDPEFPYEPVAAPVLEADRYKNSPIYFSDVVVTRDSEWTSLEDLRGSVWAYNETWSQSGYGIVRHSLVRRGETGSFFGRVVETGLHQSSLKLVVQGAVDASAIDSHVLDVMFREDPGLRSEVKVIDTLGPSTIQPLIISNRLPESLRRDLTRSVTSMHEAASANEALRFATVRRFVEVEDSDYNDIRAMKEECEKAGLTELR